MQISVLNHTKTQPPGKSYFQLEVNYKDLSTGKIASRKVVSFGPGKNVFDVLVNAKPNESYDITVVKDGQYYNWTEAKQLPPESVAAQVAKAVSVKPEYETSAERARRQILIVRQSSLSTAGNILTAGAKNPPSVDSVFALAEQFYSWVMADPEADLKVDVLSIPNDLEVE